MFVIKYTLKQNFVEMVGTVGIVGTVDATV